MTENHDDATERTEPVLVRPYVKTDDSADSSSPDSASGDSASGDSASGDSASGGETWPDKYDEQATERSLETDTLVRPVVVDDPPETAAAPAPSRRPRLVLRLLALVVGVALAGGITYLLVGRDDTTVPQPAAILPKPDTVVPTGVAASAPDKASPSTTVSSSPSASASISASVAVPQISGSVSAPVVPPPLQQQESAPASTGPTLDPPPAADRSGTITAASGRCLIRGGLLGVDGSPVQVAGCGVASTFTLAADGTLRVSGRCAQITGDSTVRIDDCDGQAAAQWRHGPGDALVNPASGQCLTDPGRSGATTKAAACTGGSEQSWTLPS